MLSKFIVRIFFSLVLVVFCTNIAVAKTFFKLKSEPELGSKYKPTEAMSMIPFDKEFDQLTDRQMQLYRAGFKGLADDDTPPFPIGGTQVVYKPLIIAHSRIAKSGYLRLIVKVDEEGLAKEVAIYESPSEKMTEMALTLFFATEFKPATCAGEPCVMDYQFEFKLRDRARMARSLNKDDTYNASQGPAHSWSR